MAWMVVGAVVALVFAGTFAFDRLMSRVREKHPVGEGDILVGSADLLLHLVGAGVLFTAGFSAARYGFGLAQRWSLLVGMAVPAAYAAGRLSWVALGLPTPWSDYDRWRDQDHRDYWG